MFSVHSDAFPGAGPRTLTHRQDSINDGGRVNHGVKGDPRSGQNRFLTVLAYLNDVKKGGRTRFRHTCYDEGEPGGSNCTEFYKKPLPGHGRVKPSGSSPKYHVKFTPQRGTAILFFPSTTAATGGYTDYNANHDAEAPGKGETKYVIQSFTWGLPNTPFQKIIGRHILEPETALTASVV